MRFKLFFYIIITFFSIKALDCSKLFLHLQHQSKTNVEDMTQYYLYTTSMCTMTLRG